MKDRGGRVRDGVQRKRGQAEGRGRGGQGERRAGGGQGERRERVDREGVGGQRGRRGAE